MNCNHEQYNNFRKKMIQSFDFEKCNPLNVSYSQQSLVVGSTLNNGEIFQSAAQKDSQPIGDFPHLAPIYIYTQRVEFLEGLNVPYLIASIGKLRFTKPNVLELPYDEWKVKHFLKSLWECAESTGFVMIPTRVSPKITKKDQKLIDHKIFDFSMKELDLGNHTKLDMIRCDVGSFEVPLEPPTIKEDGSLEYSHRRYQSTKVISKPFRMSSVAITQGLFMQVMNHHQFDPKDARFHVKTIKFQEADQSYTYDPYRCIVNNDYIWNIYHDYLGNNFRTFQSQMIGYDRPVVHVSLEEIFVFCNRLSQLQGLEPCYQLQHTNEYVQQYGKNSKEIIANLPKIVDHTKNGFRLPTVAEWQCAALAGKMTAFTETDSLKELAKYAHLNADPLNTNPTIIDVAQKKPNSWGFYDMNGNVGEICIDATQLKEDPQHKNSPNISKSQILDYRKLQNFGQSESLLIDIYSEIENNQWYEQFVRFGNTEMLYILGGSVLLPIQPNLHKISKKSSDIEHLKKKNEEILSTFAFRVGSALLGCEFLKLDIEKDYVSRKDSNMTHHTFTNYTGFRVVQNCV